MSNLALRKAVAKCAGWEWHYDYAWDPKFHQNRLAVVDPISWDDVMAACEAAIKNGKLKDCGCPVEICAGRDSVEDFAFSLCMYCGVEVSDE